MNEESSPLEERNEELQRRKLQEELQAAVRRSAPASEIQRIQTRIETLNKQIESRVTRIKRP